MRHWTPGQWVLRLVVLAGPLLALATLGLQGAAPDWQLWAPTTGLAAAFARCPESPAGAVSYVVVLVAWWADGAAQAPASALVAAAALLASHLAALVAAYGPDDVPVDRGVTGLWLGRGALVLLAAPAVWLLADTLRDTREPGGVWVAGALAVLAAVLYAIVAGRDEDPA